jgi:uncharacterized protein (TIGR02118 family)
MYKHAAFLVRQDDMSHEEFVDYWQENHTPIAREIEGVVRYATVEPFDADNAPFDGIAELYFDDLDELYDALGSEGSRDYAPDRGKAKEAREDVDNFLAIDERPRLIGEERVQFDDTDGETTGLPKLSLPLTRSEDMSHEEFVDYWLEKHAPLVRDVPGAVRYTTVLPTEPEHAEFDGIAELYFEHEDALSAFLGQPTDEYDPEDSGVEEVRQDSPKFLSMDDHIAFAGEETVQKSTESVAEQ